MKNALSIVGVYAPFMNWIARLLKLVSLKVLLWIHTDSYKEARDEFEASFSAEGRCPMPCDDCDADEHYARVDLKHREARIAEIRAEIAAL